MKALLQLRTPHCKRPSLVRLQEGGRVLRILITQIRLHKQPLRNAGGIHAGMRGYAVLHHGLLVPPIGPHKGKGEVHIEACHDGASL